MFFIEGKDGKRNVKASGFFKGLYETALKPGELLTAVVNPDHIISTKYKAMLAKAEREAVISPMPYHGEEMTVAEMIDLVEFLHAQYSKLQPQYYRGYYLTK